jgi:hypothetical protein
VPTKSVPNLIQGVSQQAVQQRRDTQCEAQFDCYNSVLSGCGARPGTHLVRVKEGLILTDAWFYEIVRGSENYIVAVKNGQLKAFNLVTGEACEITYVGAAQDYLTTAVPARNLRAQSIEDYVVVANRAKIVGMQGDLSPARPPEAIIFFKAPDYASDYNVYITKEGGTTWEARLKSTDAAQAGTELYIKTNVLAESMEYLLNGDVVGADIPIASTGDVSTTFPVPGTSGLLVTRKGSSIRVRFDDDSDFTITTESANDANGNGFLRSFKENARSLTDLPRYGFDGFQLKIRGAERTEDDDYYVEFEGDGDSGIWDEIVAPGLKYKLDPTSMPHALVNTAVDEFEFKEVAWSHRIAGDDETAKVPSFVDKRIQDLSYGFSRLCIVTNQGAVWSKSRKPFTFFPDTVQVHLDTAPVDINVPPAASSRGPSFVEKAVLFRDSFYLWAQRTQFRIATNNDQGFSAKTVEDKPDTNFEFASDVDPIAVGNTAFFATETGEWATIRNIAFENGRVQEPTDVTRHVSRYIPAGLRMVTASDTAGVQFWLSSRTKGRLYVYNWLVAEKQFAQSAWNTWRIPNGDLLWAGVNGSVLNILQQQGNNVVFLKVDLTERPVDEGISGATYEIRMDIRTSNDQVTDKLYDPETDTTSFRLPWLPEDPTKVQVIVAEDHLYYTEFKRGKVLKVLDVTNKTVTVDGFLRPQVKFYVGYLIEAVREESQFVVRDQQGAAQTPDSVTVHEFRATYDHTGYTRLEVELNGQHREVVWDGREAGIQGGNAGSPEISDGTLRIAAGGQPEDVSVRLVNDTFLPSYWQSAAWLYDAVTRGQAAR